MAERIHPEGAGSSAGAEAQATIRTFQQGDVERIRQIHAKQNLSYDLPDLTDPVFAIGAITDGAALLGKITAEMFLFLDPDYGDPQTRWQTFLELHEAVRKQALAAGLQDANFFLPPEVPEGFVRKLKELGWAENRPWRTFTFNLR